PLRRGHHGRRCRVVRPCDVRPGPRYYKRSRIEKRGSGTSAPPPRTPLSRNAGYQIMGSAACHVLVVFLDVRRSLAVVTGLAGAVSYRAHARTVDSARTVRTVPGR